MSEPIILGYAYLYPSYDGGTVLRFDTGGREINGARPSENIPLCDARQLAAKDAEIAALSARLDVAAKALGDIAKQKLFEEYAEEADPDTGDWEGAYDACVRRARAALAEIDSGKPADAGSGGVK